MSKAREDKLKGRTHDLGGLVLSLDNLHLGREVSGDGDGRSSLADDLGRDGRVDVALEVGEVLNRDGKGNLMGVSSEDGLDLFNFDLLDLLDLGFLLVDGSRVLDAESDPTVVGKGDLLGLVHGDRRGRDDAGVSIESDAGLGALLDEGGSSDGERGHFCHETGVVEVEES